MATVSNASLTYQSVPPIMESMFNSLSSDPNPSGFDFEQDRDLIALMNEARTADALESATLMARTRLRKRQAKRIARRGGNSPIRPIVSCLARALEGPGQALTNLKH